MVMRWGVFCGCILLGPMYGLKSVLRAFFAALKVVLMNYFKGLGPIELGKGPSPIVAPRVTNLPCDPKSRYRLPYHAHSNPSR